MESRPFELKCFKEPIKVSRRELYSLYTRPLRRERKQAASKREHQFDQIDPQRINRELDVVEVTDHDINNSFHSGCTATDDVPREHVPVPSGSSSHHKVNQLNAITLYPHAHPLPPFHQDIAVQTACSDVMEEEKSSIPLPESKPTNVKKQTKRKKGKSNPNRLSKRESDELVKDSLATFNRVHHLLSNQFFTDNKLYHFNAESNDKVVISDSGKAKNELQSGVWIDPAITSPLQQIWSIEDSKGSTHSKSTNLSTKVVPSTNGFGSKSSSNQNQNINVLPGRSETTHNKSLNSNIQKAASKGSNVNWNSLRRRFKKHNQKQAQNLEDYKQFLDTEKHRKLRKQRIASERINRLKSKGTDSRKDFIKRNKLNIQKLAESKNPKPKSESRGNLSSRPNSRRCPHHNVHSKYTQNVPSIDSTESAELMDSMKSNQSQITVPISSSIESTAAPSVDTQMMVQSRSPNVPQSKISKFAKFKCSPNQTTDRLSIFRIQILKQIKLELVQYQQSANNDILDIDNRYTAIRSEYRSLLRRYVVSSNPKIVQMLSSTNGKPLNMKDAMIQSQIQNGSQFKLTLLHDLMFKLKLQKVFLRWKCATYISYLRWKLINHKLTRRCNIAFTSNVFKSWHQTTTKSIQQKDEFHQFHLQRRRNTLHHSFSLWINTTRHILDCNQRVEVFRGKMALNLQCQIYQFWKYCYVHNQLHYYLRGCALRFYLRSLFSRWHGNTKRSHLIERNLNNAQDIEVPQSAILRNTNLRFDAKVLFSWNAQIHHAKRAITLGMESQNDPNHYNEFNFNLNSSASPIEYVQFMVSRPQIQCEDHGTNGISNRSKSGGVINGRHQINKEEDVERLAVSLHRRRIMDQCLFKWIEATKCRKLQNYMNLTLPSASLRRALLHWNVISNEYHDSISIAMVRGNKLQQKRLFTAWRAHKNYMKRLQMKIDINYKPKSVKKRFFRKWTCWIPQHRRLQHDLHKFIEERSHRLKYDVFYKILDHFEANQRMKRVILQFETRRMYKTRQNILKYWRRKLRNQLLLKRVFHQTQSLWNYQRHNKGPMRRKQQLQCIRKWRVFTVRRKQAKSHRVQSMMADIHRNIALQTVYYRKWKDLFAVITNYRFTKRRQIEKYCTKIPPTNSKGKRSKKPMNSKKRKSKTKTKGKGVRSKQIVKAAPYYIVPEMDIMECAVLNTLNSSKDSKPLKPTKSVKSRKKKKRTRKGLKSKKSMISTKSTRNCQSHPVLRESTNIEFTPCRSVQSHPIPIMISNQSEVKEDESSDETVNDVLLSAALTTQCSLGNMSIATSELAHDLNGRERAKVSEIAIYHFSRKWRYYKPMKQLFSIWKYMTVHPQKQTQKIEVNEERIQRNNDHDLLPSQGLNHCPTQKTIDRFEQRSRLNQSQVDQLCNNSQGPSSIAASNQSKSVYKSNAKRKGKRNRRRLMKD